MKKECKVCSARASFTCQNCAQTHYCNRAHQKEDWPVHKLHCAPFQIAHNHILGRHLVASRDLRQGEIILKEAPLVSGPRVGSSPVCVSCYRVLSQADGRTRPRVCSRCGSAWVCSIECEGEGRPHAAECATLRGHNVNVNAQWVLPLRCYLGLKRVSETKDLRWEEMMDLEAHQQERKGTVRTNFMKRFVIQELKFSGVVTDDDELLEKICSILDVNSFEIRGPENEIGRAERVKGIYLRASLMSHSCIANTHLAVSNAHQMILRAAVPISNGQIISFNYTGPIKGTTERLEMLKEEKYFTCNCERCCDPSELGTHMNSLNCPGCRKKGILTRERPEEVWRCSNCPKTVSDWVVRTTMFEARRVLDELDVQNEKVLESVLARFGRTFHPNHAIMIDIKQMLIERYRTSLLLHIKPSTKLLRKKIQLCRQILPVFQLIEPGISRLRGLTLYAYHLSVALLGNREMEAREITRKELIARLREAETLLKEATFHLSYEPGDSPEGFLAQQAEASLKSLQETIVQYEEEDKEQEKNGRRKIRGKRR